jgi:hypothetical protein
VGFLGNGQLGPPETGPTTESDYPLSREDLPGIRERPPARAPAGARRDRSGLKSDKPCCDATQQFSMYVCRTTKLNSTAAQQSSVHGAEGCA